MVQHEAFQKERSLPSQRGLILCKPLDVVVCGDIDATEHLFYYTLTWHDSCLAVTVVMMISTGEGGCPFHFLIDVPSTRKHTHKQTHTQTNTHTNKQAFPSHCVPHIGGIFFFTFGEREQRNFTNTGPHRFEVLFLSLEVNINIFESFSNEETDKLVTVWHIDTCLMFLAEHHIHSLYDPPVIKVTLPCHKCVMKDATPYKKWSWQAMSNDMTESFNYYR